MSKSKRKVPQSVGPIVGNEQVPDGGGDPAGTAVGGGGFEPLLGWATWGASGAAIGYMKSRMSPKPFVVPNRTQSVGAQAAGYKNQADDIKRYAGKIGHPSYFSDVPFNERDQMFIKIEQLRMVNQAERVRSRSVYFHRHDPDNFFRDTPKKAFDPVTQTWFVKKRWLGPSSPRRTESKITDPFKKPRE